MDSVELPAGPEGGAGWTDLTGLLRGFCRPLGDGLVNVFAPHSTVGLALVQADGGSGDDIVAALNRLLPRGIEYRHQEKAAGHGADHIIPALVSPTLTIPIIAGAPALGTFQQVVLIDLDEQPSDRKVRFTFLPAS